MVINTINKTEQDKTKFLWNLTMCSGTIETVTFFLAISR